jgi:transposase
VRRDPHTFGVPRSRWTLRTLRQQCPWLGPQSDSGLVRLLRRLGIRLKRGRGWVHSPDPDYEAKRAAVAAVLEEMAHDVAVAALYLDEVTVYRQPAVAQAYAAVGKDQALARRSLRADSTYRYIGALAAADARLVIGGGKQIDVARLVRFYQQLVAAYPAARRLYVVQDNWPVHHHPDLLVALEPQESRFTLPLPPHWPSAASAAAERRWGGLRLPIQLVWLPTYASWLNPIEKLWRKLRQEVLYHHPWADALAEQRTAIDRFFAGFAHGSPELKRYVGLAV